jgi:hypothetical protein
VELPLEEFKAPIEVHFTDGTPHPTKLQAKDVPLQLGNWRGKVDLLISTLGGMDCILGMEFITQNNVLIEGHNRLVRIPSKNGIVRVKAHEVPSVGGTTIHLMLRKNLEIECVRGYDMLCVMRVLDEFEPREATKMVSLHKCIEQVLKEFPDVMPEKLPDFNKDFEIHSDASDFAIRGVLVQDGRPVAFESKKLNETERKWPTHEKEMWVVIHCLKTWGHYIGSKDVVVWTDNVTLKYFATQPKLSSKQVRWQDTLALFNVDIRHKSRKENIVPDALSRKH